MKPPRSTLTYSPGAAGPLIGPEPRKPPPWTELAECQYVDPEIFFPEKGGSTRDARAVCAVCEVRAQCLEYAMTHPDVGRYGIWGGVSERERRRLMREQPIPFAA